MSPLARPFGVRSLADLPDLDGRSVLVRATLELPMDLADTSPLAALRWTRLTDTVRALRERDAAVTVFGDAHPPGREPLIDQEPSVASTRPGLDASVVAPDQGSVEDPDVLERLIGEHHAFVNDSFQWSYLPLPSLLAPPAHLPSAAGKGLEQDLRVASALVEASGRPFVAVLGGANSLVRLHGLQGLVLRADTVMVGGAMSLPFFEAIGTTSSRGTPDWFLSECRAAIGLAERVGHHIQLPCDIVVRRPQGDLELASPDRAPDGEVVDIGPMTAKRFAEWLHGADRVLWAGALGQVEDRSTAAGTVTVVEGLDPTRSGTFVIGGDSLVGRLESEGLLTSEMQMITATDSLLELLKNGDLPALVPLRN